MEKKTIATTISGILILIFIIAIGSTLSAFKVQKEKVEVKSIYVEAQEGIKVADKKGNTLQKLDIKSSSVGVRPATGEQDVQTKVPSTINDAVGTEGAYATFYLTTESSYRVVLLNCELTEGQEENIDNVRIAVLDRKSEAIKGSEVGKSLTEGEPASGKKLTVVVWLDPGTEKSIAAADINISLAVVNN